MKKQLLFIFCIISIGLTAQLPSYVPTNGLVGWWPFNGNANDESGNGNNGTVNGATLTSDRFGNANKAYSFNPSSNSNVTIPFSNSLNSIQNGITLSAWIYMDGGTPAGTPPRILELRGAYGGGGDAGFVMLSTTNNATSRAFELRWYNNNGNSNLNFSPTNSTLTTLNWHLVTFTADGTSGTAKYYFDGVLQSTSTNSIITQCNYNNNSLILGAEPNLLGKWGGKLDDIAIYNRALTQQEITNLFTGTVPVSCLPAYVPTNGLVGYWPFCGNANDESGNGNNGTVNGATLTTDRFGNANSAYSFDGVNDWIDCGNNIPININSSSISCWVNTTSISQYMRILGKEESQDGFQGFNLKLMGVSDGGIGKIGSNLRNNTQVSAYSDSIPILNKWYNIVLVFQGSENTNSNRYKLYINSILVSTNFILDVQSSLSNNNYPLLFGGLNGCSTCFPWNGKLDDIAIYNRALTQQEITNLFTGTVPVSCLPAYVPTNGLVGYWPFCGNANDESGNGNNGTVNGATLTTDRFGVANKAYSFNGLSNYIQTDTITHLQSSTNSISLWLNASSFSDHHQIEYAGISFGSLGRAFAFNSSRLANVPHSNCVDATTVGINNLSNQLTQNTWFHLVFISEATIGKFYLNGVFLGDAPIGSSICQSMLTLVIGRGTNSSGPKWYNGKLDDIAIYNRALTQQEITNLFTGTVPVSCLPAYVPTNGLVGYWPFCGNANDESGNGNNGTVNGATLTTDRFGVANKAYSFNGINNNIAVNPFNIAFSANQNFSVSIWFKTSATCESSAYCGGFLSQMGLTAQNGIGYQIGYDNTNKFKFEYNTNAIAQPPVHFYNTSNVIDNNWHLATICVDKVNNTIYIYCDGLLNNTIMNSWIYNSTYNTNPLFFGMLRGSDYFYNGFLDDIAIYNRALTQQEITNLYSGSAPPSITTTATTNLINCGDSSTLTASSTSAAQPCLKTDLPTSLQNGLVGYWPFCGNANDASGNNNNGTVNGATLTTDRFGNANSAYSFDGVNDWIDCGNNIPININSSSISCWVNTTSISQYMRILGKEENQDGFQGFNIKLMGVLDGGIGKIGSNLRNNTQVSAYSDSIPILNKWYNIVLVFQGSENTNSNRYKLYINSILVSTNFILDVQSSLSNNNYPLLFGGLNGCSTCFPWNGKLDDIAIYNRALTAVEVQQLYSLGNVSYLWSPGSATSPTITVSPTQTTTYTCTATNTAGSSTSSITVNVADTLIWTGAVDTNWHKPCNWNPQFVPKCCNNVLVPFTSNQPVVSGIAAAEDVTINSTSGAVIKVNAAANLQVGVCPITITQTACPSLAVITTTAVSSITQTTAVSGGTLSYQGASAVTARGICWSTSANPTLANSFTTTGTGVGTFVANLTGLTAGTTYYMRAYATNASGTSYGNEVSFVSQTLAAQYPAGSVFCAGPTAIVDVTNPTTGKTWMDRNLGATQAATSATDAAAYGDLYQWGRGSDGHQCRTSATTSTLSSTDQPGNGNFILAPNSPWDWRSPQNSNLWQGLNGVNNPCPNGYRIPTSNELNNERLSWSSNNLSGQINSVLRLPAGSVREHGNALIYNIGMIGFYWSSDFSGTMSNSLVVTQTNSFINLDYRPRGGSIRCIKN